jgi:hypothetical protein
LRICHRVEAIILSGVFQKLLYALRSLECLCDPTMLSFRGITSALFARRKVLEGEGENGLRVGEGVSQ